MINRNPASSGAGLWRELTEIAGLQPDTGYDEAILGEIATKLGLRSAVDIERELERADTGATEVLVAVLGALQPWAAMMRDLLGLMTRHGINRSRTQLRAEVDVDAASDELNLDLRDFVEAIAEYEMAMTPVRAVAWTIRAYEELASVVPSPGEVDDARLRPEVRRWLDLYEPSETGELPSTPWPTPLPTPPACGKARLDQALRIAWEGCDALLRQAAEISRSRADLHRNGPRLREREGQPTQDGPPTPGWIAHSDHDRILGLLVRGLDDVARRVRERGELKWGWSSNSHSPDSLIDLVERLPTTMVEEQTPVERLRELLSLPVWKHRYDVYSNWVFTQLVEALEEVVEVEVHHQGGLIDFGTDNTKLASVDELDLTIYCELRSKLVGTSEVRKHEVKPDYSMLRGGADPKKHSVLEVECKQYKSADRKKFVAALQDYARSREAAEVVLVGYGPVTAKMRANILGDVEGAVADRCEVLGEVRPSVTDPPDLRTRDAFFNEAYRAIPVDPATRFRLPAGRPLRIDLFWDKGSPAVDLDLHLELTDPTGGGGTVVSYEHDSIGDPVTAHLEEDVLQGPGPETLHVDHLLDFTYRLWVHRFGDGGLGGWGPRVEITAGELRRSFACPGGAGAWWCVLEVDGPTRIVTALARRDQTPGWA